jgi:hypothetical protein
MYLLIKSTTVLHWLSFGMFAVQYSTPGPLYVRTAKGKGGGSNLVKRDYPFNFCLTGSERHG